MSIRTFGLIATLLAVVAIAVIGLPGLGPTTGLSLLLGAALLGLSALGCLFVAWRLVVLKPGSSLLRLPATILLYAAALALFLMALWLLALASLSSD